MGLASALKASRCTTEDEATAAKQFIDDDVQDPGDLGDDETKAAARIDEILAKTSLGEDARAKIKKAMLEAFNKEKKEPAPAAPTKAASSKSIEAVLQGIQGIEEEERKKVLAACDKQGFIELVDLKEGAEAKLDDVLTKAGLSKDKAELCKKAILAALTKDSKTTTTTEPTPIESTAVPEGAVDVSKLDFPTLKAEKAGTISTFKIPEIFTSSIDPAHPYKSPDSLKPWQWIHLARTNNLTRALSLTRMLEKPDDAWAEESAFFWDLQEGATIDVSKGEADSTVSATVEEDQANANMVANASIAAQYGMCSASVKASYARHSSEALYSKVIHTRARWRQLRCGLIMDKCLTLAPIFQHLIDVAFEEDSVKGEDRFDYLSQLFELFGHVVPTRVYLGGLLEIKQDFVSVESQTSESTKYALDTAIGAKAEGNAGSGELKVGFAMDGAGTRKVGNCFENLQFTAIGGDPSLEGNPALWKPTVNTPENWKIISRDDVKPITQMLKPSDQDAIDDVMLAKAKQAWTEVSVPEIAGDDFTVPSTRKENGKLKLDYSLQQPILPYFGKGNRVTMKNWYSAEIGENDYLQALNAAAELPAVPVFNYNLNLGKPNLDLYGKPVGPGGPLAVKGDFYLQCQPAPDRVPDSAGSSPKEEHLLWTFVYTGRMIRYGTNTFDEPLYWIVTEDQQWVLSAFYASTAGISWTCLFPYSEEKKLRTVPSPAKWLLRPAAPPGRLRLLSPLDYRSGYFQLVNPFYKGYLADLADVTGLTWFAELPVSFQRTSLRYQLGVSPVFGSDGRPDLNKESQQQKLYKQQCWFIEDKSDPPAHKRFDQLQSDYIKQWTRNHEVGLAPVDSDAQ